MSLEEDPGPNGLVCHTEAFDFYAKDSGELLKVFKDGHNIGKKKIWKTVFLSGKVENVGWDIN